MLNERMVVDQARLLLSVFTKFWENNFVALEKIQVLGFSGGRAKEEEGLKERQYSLCSTSIADWYQL